MAAAQALSNASITDFVTVERNDYISGRVAHTKFGKDSNRNPYTVELRANWVQGLGSPGELHVFLSLHNFSYLSFGKIFPQ